MKNLIMALILSMTEVSAIFSHQVKTKHFFWVQQLVLAIQKINSSATTAPKRSTTGC
jgi:hypothetical protein